MHVSLMSTGERVCPPHISLVPSSTGPLMGFMLLLGATPGDPGTSVPRLDVTTAADERHGSATFSLEHQNLYF